MPDSSDEQRWQKMTGASASSKLPGGTSRTTAPISAPYNFIEPPEKVIATPWANDEELTTADGTPSHARPFAQAVCGTINVNWVFDRPLLIGGEEKNENHVEYNGKKVLPGTSIRGMLRNVLEITTAARVNHMDREARFAFRDWEGDASDLGNKWTIKVHPNGSSGNPHMDAGILIPPSSGNFSSAKKAPRKGWRLRPGKLARIYDAEAHLALTETKLPVWTADNSPSNRYEAIGNAIHNEISCQVGQRAQYGPYGIKWPQAVPVGVTRPRYSLQNNASLRTGRLALIGFAPGAKGKNPNNSWLFVHSYQNATPIEIPESVMDEFIRAHTGMSSEDNALDFWMSEIDDDISRSIPVVYVPQNPGDKGAIARGDIHLGLTRFMKLPHAYSVGGMADRSGSEAYKTDENGPLDFVQALFGHVPKDANYDESKPQTKAWKARLSFKHAELTTPKNIASLRKITGIAGAPRASFSPFYLRPKNETSKNHWSDDNTRLAGRKRYPVRGTIANYPEQGQTSPSHSNMNFLEASTTNNATFSAPVALHNLHPVELGGLLWALGFGAKIWEAGTKSHYHHAMGRGKAQGYGRVRANIKSINLQNCLGEELKSEELQAYVERFKIWLAKNMSEAIGETISFDQIDHIQELLAMADPEIGEELHSKLAYPIGNPAPGEMSPSIAGYMAIKNAAKASPGEITLPPYPRNRRKPR